MDLKNINKNARIRMPCGWKYQAYSKHTLFYTTPESRCEMPIITLGYNEELSSWVTYYGWTTTSCKVIKNINLPTTFLSLSTILSTINTSAICEGMLLPNANEKHNDNLVFYHYKTVCSQSNIQYPVSGPPRLQFIALRSANCEIFINSGKQCENCKNVQIELTRSIKQDSTSQNVSKLSQQQTPSMELGPHIQSHDKISEQPTASVNSGTEPGLDVPPPVSTLKEFLTSMVMWDGIKNSTVEVFQNTSSVEAIYFQTYTMIDNFSKYPDILIIHKCCEVLSIGATMYILLNVNKSRKLSVICIWFIKEQDENRRASLLMDKFKECNSSWQKIKVVMPAKNLNERMLLMSKVPQAATFTCQFHALRSFHEGIAVDRCFYMLSSDQIQTYSMLFREICLAKEEEHYWSSVKMFQESVEPFVFNYFMKYWEPVRDQWADRLKPECCSLFDNVGDGLENLHIQIRKLCQKKNIDFFPNLMCFLGASHDDSIYNSNIASAITFQKNQNIHPKVNLKTDDGATVRQAIKDCIASRAQNKIASKQNCKRRKLENLQQTSVTKQYPEENQAASMQREVVDMELICKVRNEQPTGNYQNNGYVILEDAAKKPLNSKPVEKNSSITSRSADKNQNLEIDTSRRKQKINAKISNDDFLLTSPTDCTPITNFHTGDVDIYVE